MLTREYIQERSPTLAPGVNVVTANHPHTTVIRGIATNQTDLCPFLPVRDHQKSEAINKSVKGCQGF